jgi:hypothetical protein
MNLRMVQSPSAAVRIHLLRYVPSVLSVLVVVHAVVPSVLVVVDLFVSCTLGS